MLTLATMAAGQIARHAEAIYPDECVGMLLGWLADDGAKIVVRALAVENRWAGQVRLAETDNAQSRRDRFYLDPHDYMWADREARAMGLSIVGCYHSHPDHAAIPSAYDLAGAQGIGGGAGFAFVIQSVYAGRAGDLAAWLLVDAGARFVREELSVTG